MILNSVCYCLNSYALGDVIAAAPVIKWMIDHSYNLVFKSLKKTEKQNIL